VSNPLTLRNPRTVALVVFLATIVLVPVALRAILGEGAEAIPMPALFVLTLLVALGAAAGIEWRNRQDAARRSLNVRLPRMMAEVTSMQHPAGGWIHIAPRLTEKDQLRAWSDVRETRLPGRPIRALYPPLHVMPDRVVAASYFTSEMRVDTVERWLPVVAEALERVGASMTDGVIEYPEDAPTSTLAWRILVEDGRWEVWARDASRSLTLRRPRQSLITNRPEHEIPVPASAVAFSVKGAIEIVPPLADLDLYGTWNDLHDAWSDVEQASPGSRAPCPLEVDASDITVSWDEWDLTLEDVLWWLPIVAQSVARAGSALMDGELEMPSTEAGIGWRVVVEGGVWKGWLVDVQAPSGEVTS
jgi:hypothetical protein